MLTPLQSLRTVAAILLVAVPGFTRFAHAQAHAGANVLQDPISIRATSMGLTGAADNSDPGNLWFNPANVVMRPGIYADYGTWKTDPFFDWQFPFTRWSAMGSFGISEDVVVGVGASFGELDYGTVMAYSPTSQPLREFHVWERYVSFALGVQTRLDERVDLRLGAAGKWYWANFGSSSFTQDPAEWELDGLAFDAGAAAALPIAYSGWTVTPALALACVNFGGEIDVPSGSPDPFPGRVHYGASVRVDGPATKIGSAHVPLISFVQNVDAIDYLHDDPWSWGMGAELSVAQVLFLRAGVMDDQDGSLYEDDDRSAWGVGIGVPVGPVRARFDYGRVYDYDEPRYGAYAAWEL